MSRREVGPRDSASDGSGSMRVAATFALALLLALWVGAPSTSAAPLTMTFTEARADVGVQLSDHPLLAPPATAPFDAQIDPGTGSITAGALDVPDFSTHITEPIEADVTVEFDIGTVTGGFVEASGAVTLKGEAGGTLISSGASFEDEECIVSTTPAVLELSTAGEAAKDGSPPSGAPFTVGLTGPGAIAGQWTDMHAAPVDSGNAENVDFCEDVDGRIGGPGGIWLKQEGDLLPPTAPLLTGFNPPSPSLSDAPRLLGAAETGSIVRIYSGPGCLGAPVTTGSAAELGFPGITVEVAQDVTATFSAAATDAALNMSPCSASISYTRQKFPRLACIVPKLRGKTLKRAKAALERAGCKLGKVRNSRRLRSKLRRTLVVKRSNPGPGAEPANRKVHLKLGPRRKTHRSGAHHRALWALLGSNQ